MARVIFFLFVVFSLTGLLGPGAEAEFYGAAPTGLLELEKKHPYYLFVPPDYSPEKSWPLAVIFGETEKDPRDVAASWADWAKANGFLVLVPAIFPRDGALPDELNQWLLDVKREVTERYRVHPSQILLVGLDSGAPYAAYLGVEYPSEFGAAALIRKAWGGPLAALTEPSSDPERQIPFYVAVDPKDAASSEVESQALAFEKKGYPVTLESLEADPEFSKVQERITAWFRADLESRTVTENPAKTKRGFKGILKEIKKNVFED